jgi:hypothetical protein
VLDRRVAYIEELSLRLYSHMEKRFDDVEAKLDCKANKKQVDLVLGTLDTMLKNQETDEQERLIAK